LESPKERDHSEDRGVDGRMGSKWTLGRLAREGVWCGFTWLRKGTVGGLLSTRWWIFVFFRLGVSSLKTFYTKIQIFVIFSELAKGTGLCCFYNTHFWGKPWPVTCVAFALREGTKPFFKITVCGQSRDIELLVISATLCWS
jgi:hypothetical protein